jgi:hypothetical protein
LKRSQIRLVALSIGTLLQLLPLRAAHAGPPVDPICAIGKMIAGTSAFYVDANLNGIWNGSAGGDWSVAINAQAGPGTPFVGDWNDDGFEDPGKLVGTTYSLDLNGNGVWNGNAGGDRVASFAASFGPGVPLVGDWDGDGDDEIGTYIVIGNQSRFYLDVNGNGLWGGAASGDQVAYLDYRVPLGGEPVIGEWNNDTERDIGKYVGTTFYLDLNGNGIWNTIDGGDFDQAFAMAFGPGVPLVGDWNGDGADQIGVYIPTTGKFLIDRNGNRQYDGPPGDSDVAFAVFAGQGTPLICDWDDDGDDDLGLVVGTQYYIDINGNGVWNGNAGGDRATDFRIGGVGTPVAGEWEPH